MLQPRRETDEELLARYKHVTELFEDVIAQMNRLRLGSYKRTKKAMWGGCLNFTRGQIESELEKRGLSSHITYPSTAQSWQVQL